MTRLRRRLLPRVAFGVTVAVALVLGGEGLARVAGVPAWSPESAVLGRPLPPDQRARRVDQADPLPDFTFTTNADGLRTSLSRARTPGVRRVAIVGDSTVLGWGVELADSVPGRLEVALGEGWEVLDAGQPGYSSEQVRRLVEGVVAAYTPDVFVFVQPWHDVNEALRPDRAVLDNEPLPPLLRLRMVSRLYALAHPTTSTPGPQRPPDPSNGERLGERVPAADRAAARDAMRAALPGVPFVVALFPTDNDLRRGHHPGGPFDAELAAWAKADGATFVDLRDTFTAGELDAVTLPGDPGHFDGDGAARLAARLAEAVRAAAG